jgi:hypothetical protein
MPLYALLLYLSKYFIKYLGGFPDIAIIKAVYPDQINNTWKPMKINHTESFQE